MTIILRSTRSTKMYELETGKLTVLDDCPATSFDETAVSKLRAERQGISQTRYAAGQFCALRRDNLALNDCAKPLEEFKDVKELLQVFHDAIKAHHDAFHLANVLHHDISPMTIMIGSKGHGSLVDWDLRKPDENRQRRYLERVGTWDFMAYRLVEARKRGDPFPEHDENDDLESFWYVLYWLALRRCENTANNVIVSSELEVAFGGSYLIDGDPVAPMSKLSALLNTKRIGGHYFLSSPLAKILKEYQCVIRLRYKLNPAEIEHITRTWMQIQNDYSTSSEKEQTKQLMLALLDSDCSYYSIGPDARLLSNKEWAQDMLADALTKEPPSAWEIGGGNKLRDHLRRNEWQE